MQTRDVGFSSWTDFCMGVVALTALCIGLFIAFSLIFW
jgi:hypothetical protein